MDNDESDEVLLQDSLLYEYLKEVGFSSDFDDCTSVLNEATLPIVKPDNSRLKDEKEQRSDNSHLKNDGKQKCWSLLPRIESRTDEIRKRLIDTLLNSAEILEEHHQYLLAYMEAFLANKTQSPSQLQLAYWIAPHLSLNIGLMIAKRTNWNMASKFMLSSSILGVITTVSVNLYCFVQSSYINAIVQKVEQIVYGFHKCEILWKRILNFLQEMSLVHLGAVIISKKSTRGNRTSECITIPIRKAANLFFCDSIRHLTSEIKILSEYLNNEYKMLKPNISIDTTRGSIFSMNSLQELHSTFLLLTSQWMTLCILSIYRSSANNIFQLISSLSGLKYPQTLESVLNFQIGVLDGQFESPHPRRSYEVLSAREHAAHSLYLHSRELLRLTKLLDLSAHASDEICHNIYRKINDCRVCLDTCCKSQPRSSQYRGGTLEVEAENLGEEDVGPLPDNTVVMDQIFVETAGSADSTEQDPTFVNDYEEQLRAEYEKYLMGELRGVISELAKERETRESNLKSGQPQEEISRKTQALIETRDIKALIQNAAVGMSTERDTAKEATKDDENTVTEKPNKYQVSISNEEMQEKLGYSEMKLIAGIVASKFKKNQEVEQTYGSDTDDTDESD